MSHVSLTNANCYYICPTLVKKHLKQFKDFTSFPLPYLIKKLWNISMFKMGLSQHGNWQIIPKWGSFKIFEQTNGGLRTWVCALLTLCLALHQHPRGGGGGDPSPKSYVFGELKHQARLHDPRTTPSGNPRREKRESEKKAINSGHLVPCNVRKLLRPIGIAQSLNCWSGKFHLLHLSLPTILK